MGIRALRRLPPPTMQERAAAANAARALRIAIVDPSTRGARSVLHIDYSRRRSEWIETWAGLPGFMRVHGKGGRRYQHEALPGWEYTGREILAEMIPDLETLALHGERPLQATR